MFIVSFTRLFFFLIPKKQFAHNYHPIQTALSQSGSCIVVGACSKKFSSSFNELSSRCVCTSERMSGADYQQAACLLFLKKKFCKQSGQNVKANSQVYSVCWGVKNVVMMAQRRSVRRSLFVFCFRAQCVWRVECSADNITKKKKNLSTVAADRQPCLKFFHRAFRGCSVRPYVQQSSVGKNCGCTV